MPGTSERVITDSSEARREFVRLRVKDAEFGDPVAFPPDEVFWFLRGLAFTPEKLLTSNIRVKRKFKSKN